MQFLPLELAGAVLVRMQPARDRRGAFARSFCAREFAAHGLPDGFVQANVSWNERRGTVRGLHYQRAPYGESKLVRCSRGELFDVIVDVRRDSPTRGRWLSLVLAGDGTDMLYVPPGFAHGFQTLRDDTEVSYLMGEFHTPGHAVTLSYRHRSLGVDWPLEPRAVSDADQSVPPDGEPEWV